MCEIFGYSSRSKDSLNEYLDTFFARSMYHPHGWGLAHIEESWHKKEPVRATDSQCLQDLLQEDVAAKALLAHIRYATVGQVEPENCHPFIGKDISGRTWTLIHNGTIFEGPQLEHYFKEQRGATDSERFLLHIIECMNEVISMKKRGLERHERFQIINGLVCALADQNKLNLLIHDGEMLYVHTNMADSLHMKRSDGRVVIATSPLDDGSWERVPFTQLLGFISGTLCYKGTVHGKEYFPKPEELALLYQIYSGL